MGSGKRFMFYTMRAFGIGVYISRFPFSLTIDLHFLVFGLQLAFGKGYDE